MSSPADAKSAPYLLPGRDAEIKKLTAPEQGEVCFWHPAIKGLHLRLLPTGQPTWRYQYRDQAGATRKVTLGKHPAVTLQAAVTAAQALAGDTARGNDPAAARRALKTESARRALFGDLLPTYLAWKETQRRARTVESIRHYLENAFKHLHAVPIGELDQFAIAAAVERVKRERGAIAANRATSALSGFLRWLGAQGKVRSDVALGPRMLPKASETSRDRVLTPEELKAIWDEAKPESNFGRIIRLLLLTAGRRDEIGSLRWSEISKDAITIDGERMKGKRDHAIPLLPAMARLLPPKQEGDFVFGKDGDAGFSAWSQSLKRFNGRLLKRMGKKPGEVPRWTMHDFRRTFSTMMNDQPDAKPHVIEACLAHMLPGVAGVYSRAEQLESKKAVLTSWCKVLKRHGIDVEK